MQPELMCTICEQECLYDAQEELPQLAAEGKRRCDELHRGACKSCLALDSVDLDEKDYCAECAEKQFLCIVCCAQHLASGGVTTVRRPETVTGVRCWQHEGWCAACMAYAVAEPNDVLCGKCTREGRQPAGGRAQLDDNVLRLRGHLCISQQKKYGCKCSECSRGGGDGTGGTLASQFRVSLPPPPTAREEELMSQVARLSEEVRRLRKIMSVANAAATLPSATLEMVPGPPIRWTAALCPMASGPLVAAMSGAAFNSEPLNDLGAQNEEAESSRENSRISLNLWHAPPLL